MSPKTLLSKKETVQSMLDNLNSKIEALPETSRAPLAADLAQLRHCISEQMASQTTQLLAQSEERYRAKVAELEAIMDAVPAYVWITRDPESRYITGNRAAHEILKMKPGENLSKTAPEAEIPCHFRAVRSGQEIPPLELPVQKAASQGIAVRDYEFDLVFDDGETVCVIGNATPILDENGSPAGAVSAFIDITERKAAEEAQRVMQDKNREYALQMEVQRRLTEFRERERQELAREIHDGPIQTLVSSIFNMQYLKEAFENPTLRTELDQLGLTMKSAVRELRDVINELRPPSLIRFGLVKAIRIHAADFQERHPEIAIDLDLEDDASRLDEPASLTLFRIYQEGLNNVARHANAGMAWVSFRIQDDQAVLEIRDDGQGFEVNRDLSALMQGGHFGLAGMIERAETVGGEVNITSSPEKGTTVWVQVPVA